MSTVQELYDSLSWWEKIIVWALLLSISVAILFVGLSPKNVNDPESGCIPKEIPPEDLARDSWRMDTDTVGRVVSVIPNSKQAVVELCNKKEVVLYFVTPPRPGEVVVEQRACLYRGLGEFQKEWCNQSTRK